MVWGPYADAGEARQRTGSYADAMLGPHAGVLWTMDTHSVWLRRPVPNASGFGRSLLVRCTPAPPPPTLRPTGMQRLEAVLGRAEAMAFVHGPEVVERLFFLPPGTLRMVNKYMVQPADAWLNRHPAAKDGLVVAADVAGVIAGGMVLVAIAPFAGAAAVTVGAVATIVAGGACLALLVEDGRHLWYTANGNEAGRVALESSSHYRWIQAVAPWLTLPDLAMGGRTVVREAAEASSFAARAGARAAQSSTRAQSAARDLRLTIAEGADGRTIHAAALEAQKRAERFRLMQKLVQRANFEVLAKRNAVAATAGGIWGVRQYVNEPPKLVEEKLDQLKGGREHGREGTAAPVRSHTAAHLLAPARPHPSGAHTNLHVMTMVSRASARL